MSDKTATTLWDMICIAFFRGNFISSLLQIDSYKNMLRNFKSHKNGLPLVKMDARFVDENKNNLKIKNSNTIPLQSDKWTKDLESSIPKVCPQRIIILYPPKIVRRGYMSPILQSLSAGDKHPLSPKICPQGTKILKTLPNCPNYLGGMLPDLSQD